MDCELSGYFGSRFFFFSFWVTDLVFFADSIIDNGVSWRWVFWVMMFFAAGCTLVTLPFLPETYAPVILLKKARLSLSSLSSTNEIGV